MAIEFVGLVILILAALVSGPIALVLVLTLFGRIQKLEHAIQQQTPRPQPAQGSEPVPSKPQPTGPASSPFGPTRPAAQAAPPVSVRPKLRLAQAGLEQKIGTTAALIAGVMTVIVGVGFFLKYIYENAWFGPIARVCIIAVGGLTAMVIGEITRRRDYEIVAKGTTAMGFALLYAAVFSASRVYMLIETNTAFVLAMAITAGAMGYAVLLNEVVIALLSMLGGYLSPFVISTGQNLAMPLFSYLLALAVGAMGCALFRRWRAVNWVAMVGTYVLFTGWFEKFYTPAQMAIALSWLGVFGGLFLLVPVVYGLMRRAAARAEEVGLVAANSVAVFYYLWRILYAEHSQAQALAAALVGGVHLALAAAVQLRCREDRRLIAALGVLGTAFLTAAIPLYFVALNPTLLSWTVEAAALTYIGIRYRSRWTKAMGCLVSAVAAAGLFYHLPLHPDPEFRFLFNPPFGTWLFVAAGALVCHFLWRMMAEAQDNEGRLASQVYYIAAVLLAALGCALEWAAYCDFYIEGFHEGHSAFLQGMMVLLTGVVLVLLARPPAPKGELVRAMGVFAAVGGAAFVVLAMKDVHIRAFVMFFNGPFGIAALYVAAMMVGTYRVRKDAQGNPRWKRVPAVMGMLGLLLVWVVLSQEVYSYWACRDAYAGPVDNWWFFAQMSISVAWALYAAALVVGGFVCHARAVRYLSLLIFAVLLGKIFLKDTVTLQIEYRIAAFLTTGLILVGVSFVYQYLRKKHFFDDESAG